MTSQPVLQEPVDPLAVLYQESPPIVSSVWRLHFINPRESSQNDVFALLHDVNIHVAINVKTVVRTWDDQIPVYWVLFEDAPQALVARGFATNAEGRNSIRVTGALVEEDLFRQAEEEERNPHFIPPIEPNRWDYPLLHFYVPPTGSSETPSAHNRRTSSHTRRSRSSSANASDPPITKSSRPLHERIQHATLLERLNLA